MTDGFDVIVVGGGPGGSTAASLIALDGHRVLLLEKETFPRYQIGESLLPSTVHGICAMLGVRDEILRAGFTPKRGGTFKWGANPEPWTFSFALSRRMAGPTSYALQVERTRFDTILLQNAVRLGVDVRQEHRVTGVLRDGDGRVCGVRYVDPEGTAREATARFVVDASGSGSRLHDEVGGKREYSPFFRNLALFGYFENGRRMPPPNSGNILCVAFDSGWFWYIPLSETLTSVGAVVRREAADRVQGDPEAALAALIDECPLIKSYLSGAKRSSSKPYDELRVRKDYSYDRTALWSPGLVLVGDAACFIDPVFSSGVHLSTYSAMLAARSVNSVLAGTLDEERCFREFEDRYRHEFALFRDFLVAFYQTHTDEESYFWQARKVAEHRGAAAEAFVDLVGGVVSGDFSGMARAMAEASTRTDDIGDVTGMHEVGVISEVMAESAQLQLRGMLGEAMGDEPPMFPGGLVPSGDGRRWREPDLAV
ncbi:tryptophan 7-halogenase [Streptosporangium sp. NPDC002607]